MRRTVQCTCDRATPVQGTRCGRAELQRRLSGIRLASIGRLRIASLPAALSYIRQRKENTAMLYHGSTRSEHDAPVI